MKYILLIPILVICLFSCSKKLSLNNEVKSDSSIVGHWSLDGDANDQSLYMSHGKIYGDPQQVDGIIKGKAFDFNGDDYIEISEKGTPPSHLKKLTTGSISLWFKARDWDINTQILPILYYGQEDGCIDAFDATNGGMIIEVGHGGIFPSENVFFTLYDQVCAKPTMCFDSNNGAGLIEPEKWYHFVAVVGEDFNTGYLNGKELVDRRYNFNSESSTLFFNNFISHDKMWIGKGFWKNNAVYFDGLIDDVRIYNKALDLNEIQDLYNESI